MWAAVRKGLFDDRIVHLSEGSISSAKCPALVEAQYAPGPPKQYHDFWKDKNVGRTASPRIQPLCTDLTPLERKLINALLDHLRPDAATILGHQLQAINLVQRFAGSREVNCYPMIGRKAIPRSEEPVSVLQILEVLLATISFFDPQGNSRYSAEFYVCKGYFFSISFDRNPAGVTHADDVVIEGVSLHSDPMAARTPPDLVDIPAARRTFRSGPFN